VENVGLEQFHEPRLKHIEDKLRERRVWAAEGIAGGLM
jgi:hypothetical protein